MLTAQIKLILFLIGLQIFFGIFEHWRPAEKGQSLKGRLRNIMFTSIYIIIGGVLASGIRELVPESKLINADITMPHLVILVFIIVFMKDVIFYWYHRLEHKSRVFWSVHELHHSDAELNSSTSTRSHLLEKPLQYFLIVLPALLLIGTNVWAAYLTLLFEASWSYFTHSNIRVSLGSLTPVFVGPQLHRIHHSVQQEHQNKNFAQFFPVIDIVFGTYYEPKRDEFPMTGVDTMPTDVSVLRASLRPFVAWVPNMKEVESKMTNKKEQQ